MIHLEKVNQRSCTTDYEKEEVGIWPLWHKADHVTMVTPSLSETFKCRLGCCIAPISHPKQ